MTRTGLALVPSSGARDDKPATIFVGGCDRSGTTFVGRVLAEQLSLVAVPEAYFHVVAYRRFGAGASARLALDHWRRVSWGVEDMPGDEVALTEFLRSRLDTIYESRRGPGHAARVVESTPGNIEIGTILLEEFPDAHLVHVVRDPRAVAASLKRVDFGPRSAQECARMWKQRVASGLALEAMHSDRVHRLRYEDLLFAPASIGALREAVPDGSAIEFDLERDVMIDPTSAAVQQQSDKAVDVRRAWSWRGSLTGAEVAAVEFECAELMHLFGYTLDGFPDDRAALARRIDTLRSITGELTFGMARRALRAGASVLRSSR